MTASFAQDHVFTREGTNLRRGVVERNIVDSISRASVGRFLGEAQIKPHLTKGWLNSPERDTPEFTEAAQSVCDVYQQALERHAQESIC